MLQEIGQGASETSESPLAPYCMRRKATVGQVASENAFGTFASSS